MAINKIAKNITIKVTNDYFSKSGSLIKVAERINIEAVTNDLILASNKKIESFGEVLNKGIKNYLVENSAEEINTSAENASDFKAVVQFYRSVEHSNGNYGKKDKRYSGEFGFDKFDTKVHSQGFVKEYIAEKEIPRPDKIYVSEVPYYLCPYLSIWPPNVPGNDNRSDSNDKHIVTLFVRAEKAKEKSKIEEDIIYFKSSNAAAVKISTTNKKKVKENSDGSGFAIPLKIGEIDENQITVECLFPFSKEVYIEALTKEGNLVGKLILVPNNIRYHTEIQPVKIVIGPTASQEIQKVGNSPFMVNLRKEFNTHAYNQAYIWADLAGKTHEITLSIDKINNENIKYLFTDSASGSKNELFLKKTSEKDSDTIAYSELIEKRYAAYLESDDTAKKKSAEEDLEKDIRVFFIKLKSNYKHPGDSITDAYKKGFKEKRGFDAWNHFLNTDRNTIDKKITDYNGMKGEDEIVLNKKNKIHIFFSEDIYAAGSPAGKVLAYSAGRSGVTHIFNSAFEKSNNEIDSIITILHEIGHSLGLSHTFNGNRYILLQEDGEIYDQIELDQTIFYLESVVALKEQRKEFKKEYKKIVKSEKISIYEAIIIGVLSSNYKEVKSIINKNSPKIDDYISLSNTFSRIIELEQQDSIVEIELKESLTNDRRKAINELNSIKHDKEKRDEVEGKRAYIENIDHHLSAIEIAIEKEKREKLKQDEKKKGVTKEQKKAINEEIKSIKRKIKQLMDKEQKTLDEEMKNIEKEIQGHKSELEKLKNEEEPKTQKYSGDKDQSKSIENYMDYTYEKDEFNSDGTPRENSTVLRKVFYQWQWNMMRETGSRKGYLE